MTAVPKGLKVCPREEGFCLPCVTPVGRDSRDGDRQEAIFSSNEEEASRSVLTPMARDTQTGVSILPLAGTQANMLCHMSYTPMYPKNMWSQGP